MADVSSSAYNVYSNVVTGATVNPVMQNPDEIDEVFAQGANDVLKRAAEIARLVVGAHQSAIAIIVDKDWGSVRKYFSLSEKYKDWAGYAAPAKGFGTHAWLLEHNQTVRFTQAELEAHPAWMNFGTESAAHPPMRGWMATPLVDRDGRNWGLFQLSDKYEGDFTEADEAHFVMLAQLVAIALESLWEVRNLQKAAREA
ncbi:MAG: GAF domain-containing protein [Pleurocapsa minor GSE-CHR-MK-17-07R]|jgi:GAF domain-containing protein|nr:GAF domain-containing protein [Pleurocapsa minor GSE-CHR-MK 17-07R]